MDIVQQRLAWYPSLSKKERSLLEENVQRIWAHSLRHTCTPIKKRLYFENLLERSGMYHGVCILEWLAIPQNVYEVRYSRIDLLNGKIKILLALA